jgi:hypothetical protein
MTDPPFSYSLRYYINRPAKCKYFFPRLSIPKTLYLSDQADKLKRKPSAGERAWFLEEESEPRN